MSVDEVRRQKARALRYKKPMLKSINMCDILVWLEDTSNECEEWAWADITKRDMLIDALDGNEDEYASYQMEFATLSNDLEQMSEDLQYNDIVLGEFDDVMVGIKGSSDNAGMFGYDEFEGDYMTLENSYEEEVAIEEAQKRLIKKHTKAELIELTSNCLKIALNYMALDYRFRELATARDILHGINFDRAKDAMDINNAYDELVKYDKSIETKQYDNAAKAIDAIAQKLPNEAWLR